MKSLASLFAILLMAIVSVAQSPQAFKYQTIVRDNTGEIMANKLISLQISIREGSAGGTILYQEAHDLTTNQFGLVNLEIGSEIPAIGSFTSIDWGVGLKFLEVGIDTTGGSSYISMGTTQLVSVPYALHAETSANAVWDKNGSEIFYNDGNVGIGTSTPIAPLDLRGSNTDDGVWMQIGNSDESHQLKLFGGREFDPNPFIFWKGTDPLRFATDLNGWTEHMRISNNGNIGIGTLDPTAKLHVQDTNGVLFTGNFGNGNIPVEGSGTRLMWYPGKGAFRVGYVNGSWWDDTNIGDNSMAMGFNTTASGLRSTALGSWSSAEGEVAVAIGEGSEASGNGSVAIGFLADANGYVSTAIGANTEASGSNSFAIGAATTATGEAATAMGFGTTAQSYRSFVVGSRNITSGTTDSWVDTDPIFVIGNGLYPAFSNAMTVLKNGNVGIGTTNPGQRLTINGGDARIVGIDGWASTGHKAKLFLGDPNHGLMASHSEGLRIYSYDSPSHDIRFQDHTGTDYMTIKMGSGNVGIGTTNPTESLQIAGNIRLEEAFYDATNYAGYNGDILQSTGTATNWVSPSSIYDGDWWISGDNIVRYEGNVGIGLGNPYTKLTVNEDFPSTNTTEVVLALFRGSTGNPGNGEGVALEFRNETGDNPTGYVPSGYISSVMEDVNSPYSAGMHFQTIDGIFFSDGLYIDPVGNIGMGTTDPQSPLHIDQKSVSFGIRLDFSSSSNWQTYVDGVQDYNFAYNGALKSYIQDIDGSYVIASDKNLKKDITPFPNIIDKVKLLQPSYYRFIDNGSSGKKSIGLIAQEVEPLFPEVVHEKDGIKAINYDAFAVIAIQAIKEQQEMIENQQSQIEELKNMISQLVK